MAEQSPQSKSDSPIAIRRSISKPALLVCAGGVVALLLLIVVINLDRKNTPHASSAGEDPNLELVPSRLTTGDVSGAGLDLKSNPQDIRVPEGGGIQITDPKTGKLAQNYVFTGLDPNPDGKVGWSRMRNPAIQFYLADNRVLTLKSDTAIVRVPKKAPEEGTMSGQVVIQMYDDIVDRQVDERADTPSLVIHTEEASFNNFQGEIRSPGDVDIQTPSLHLPGRGLRLQINDKDKRPESLTIDHVKVIRIASTGVGVNAPASRPAAPTSAPAVPPASSVASTQAATTKPSRPAKSSATPKAPTPNKTADRPPAAAADSQPQPQFYRLTLSDNVHIQQNDGTTGWTADGSDLNIIFSMKGKSMLASRDDSPDIGSALTAAPQESTTARRSPTHGLPIAAVPASLAFAALPTDSDDLYQSGENETRITCDGPLTMVPLVNGAARPASPDDTRITLNGAPVLLKNPVEKVEIRCATLAYQTLAQKLDLDGTADQPLLIDSPELHAVAQHLWINQLDHNGAFVGPGVMTTGNRNAAPATAPADPRIDDVRIAWTDGVDMTLEPTGSDTAPTKGKLRQATFRGGVDVGSSDIVLKSDRLQIGFPPEANASQKRTIQSLLAEGSVHAHSVSDQGSIDCGTLSMKFIADAAGKTTPTLMNADGDVAATDKEHQTVWADHLEVTFLPPDAVGEARTKGGVAKVKMLTATDDVQVLLADGARAFAQKLEADAANDVAVLSGSSIAVVSDRSIVRGGTRLELRKSNGKATWPGAGEFAYYTNPIAPLDHTPIERPVVDEKLNPRQMQANWADSMVYDSRANEGAGSIVLQGGVRAQSTPSVLEINTMNGQSLTLDFSNRAVAAGTQPAATAPSGSRFDPTGGSGRRQLRELLAKGDAKLESRTWLKPDHTDTPRVFYLSGPSVRYKDQTLESLVDGEGELLVRDETAPTSPATTQPHAQAIGSAPFSSKGTSLFRWKQKLEMVRVADGTYRITMLKDVEVRHMALDQALSTITADMLEAFVSRSAPRTKTDGAANRDAAFDLGGSMSLNRLRGSGGVYIDTTTRDVQCDDLDYDYAAGIATLTSKDPRTVMVTTQGNPHPIRAGKVIWNIIEDKITATNVSGAAPR